ncbi:MAG: type II secretion system protein [Candidatus Firestonebacteria bacterium]
MLKNQKGFTFILCIISVVILGITTTSIIALISTTIKREKEEELLYRLDKIRTALKEYRRKTNRYPSHLEELLINKYIRNCYLIDPITNKEWENVYATLQEGYGIKDVHSSREEIAMKLKNWKEVKYNEF